MVELDSGSAVPAVPQLIPANKLFKVSNGDEAWRQAMGRILQARAAGQDSEGNPEHMPVMGLGQGKGFYFRRGTGFRVEQYGQIGERRLLMLALTAEEAVTDGSQMRLRSLKLVYNSPRLLAAWAGIKEGEAPSADFTHALGRTRMVLTARNGAMQTGSMIGEAMGGVRIELFSEDPGFGAAPGEPSGVLDCERLRWRSWKVPSTGAVEMALYVMSEDPGRPDPLVRGRFVSQDPAGLRTTRDIEARGMIFETSETDQFGPVRDEAGTLLGQTRTLRQRIIFHREIKLTIQGLTSMALIPFQRAAQSARKKGDTPQGKRKAAGVAKEPSGSGGEKSTEGEAGPEQALAKPAAPEIPSLTQVACAGPAILDLAVLPRVAQKTPAPGSSFAFAQRFEFLNGVSLIKAPLDAQTGKPLPVTPQTQELHAKLQCRHLCLQHPPLASKGAPASERSALPEYAEAVGGVHIEGFKAGSDANAPAAPFHLDAYRVYFDILSDTLTLAGLPGTPVELESADLGKLTTQLCLIPRGSQLPIMPAVGHKSLEIRGGAVSALAAPTAAGAAPAKGPEPQAGAPPATLRIQWQGPFSTQRLRSMPAEARVWTREILRFEREVEIHQGGDGLTLHGDSFEIALDVARREVKDPKSGQVKVGEERSLDRLEGLGHIKVRGPDLEVTGDRLTLQAQRDAAGKVCSSLIQVDPAEGATALPLLRAKGNLIRGRRFLFDPQKGLFQVLGGAVGLASMSAPTPASDPRDYFKKLETKPTPAPAHSMLPQFTMNFSGPLRFQCDGDLAFDPQTGLLTVKENVLVQQQEQLKILADRLQLAFAKPAQPPGGKEGTGQAAGAGLFSGAPSALSCEGQVELIQPEQLIHCDRLSFNLQTRQGSLSVLRPEDVVRIYLKDPATGGTKLLEILQQLDINGEKRIFDTGGRGFNLLPFHEDRPLPRGTPPHLKLRKRPVEEP